MYDTVLTEFIGNSTEYCGGGSRLNLYMFEAKSDSTTTTGTGTTPITTPSASTSVDVSTTTTETSTSATASAGPSVKDRVGNWVFQDCWTEMNDGRVLSSQTLAEDGMTLEVCAKYCSGFAYFGIEYGRECYCGDAIKTGSSKAQDASTCSMVCSGDATTYCGGSMRLQLYKYFGTLSSSTNGTTTAATSTAAPTAMATATQTGMTAKAEVVEQVGNWHFEACWVEMDDGRVLSNKTLADDDMTLGMCGDYCSGLKYFGIEYGRECYCGDSLKEGSVEAEDPDTCSSVCPGDATALCGGSMRLQLYKYRASNATFTASTSHRTTTASASLSTVSGTTKISSAAATGSSNSTSTFVSGKVAGSSSTIDESSTTASSTLKTTKSSASSTETSTTASPSSTGPIVSPGNANFTFYSCVQEPSAGKLMDDQIYNNGTNMTIKSCLERCWEYDWAGVEYGRECWCGGKLNLKGNEGATSGKNVTESKCSFLCPGDDEVYCGASSLLSLYISKDLYKETWGVEFKEDDS